MKLSESLLSSGVLGRGETRHCSEWEFSSGERKSWLNQSALVVQQAEARRAQGMQARAKRSFWAKAADVFGGKSGN